MFAVLTATALPPHLYGTQFLRPGDNGSILFEVDNDAQSGGPMTNVVVNVSAPSSVIQQSSSKLGPVASIAPGQSFTFQLDYAIDPNAVDGNFSVTLQATQDTQYVTPRVLTSTTNFTITASAPVVTILEDAASALYQNFSGVSQQSPSTILPSFFNSTYGGLKISVSPQGQAALASVNITGPLAATFDIGTDGTVVFNNFPADPSVRAPPGAYILTAVDSEGGTTIAPFTIANIVVSGVGSATCDPATGNFSGTITLSINSTLELASAQMIVNQRTGQICQPAVGSVQTLSGTNATETFTVDSNTDFINIVDVDGNEVVSSVGLIACDPSSGEGSLGAGAYPYYSTEFDVGNNQSAPIGPGVSVSGLNVTSPGQLNLAIASPNASPGYRSVGGYQLFWGGGAQGNAIALGGAPGVGYIAFGSNGCAEPVAVPASLVGSFTLNVGVSDQILPGNLSASFGQPGEFLSVPQIVPVQGGIANLTVDASQFNPGAFAFLVETPLVQNPAYLYADPSDVLYDGKLDPGLTFNDAAPNDQTLAVLLTQARRQGLQLDSNVVQMGPEGTHLNAQAYLTMSATSQGGSLYELSPGQAPQLLPGQSSAYSTLAVTARVTQINSYFAVFTATVPDPGEGVIISGQAGRDLGLDAKNLLWSIAFDNDAVVLAHNDANGVMTASVTLPSADHQGFPWSVFFDTAGSAYAVGAALAPNGADQVAVYKASPSGSAIVSSQFYDSGFNSNNFVFDVAAPGWIVGGVQTSGARCSRLTADRPTMNGRRRNS